MMGACSQTRVADQLVGASKPLDVADSRQQDHGVNKADPWQLRKVSHLVDPGFLLAQSRDFLIAFGDERRHAVQESQVMAHPQPFGSGQRQVFPPLAVYRAEYFATWCGQIVPLQYGPQPAADARALPDQALAVRNEAAQLANLNRRHPNCGNKACAQQARQSKSVLSIRLNGRFSDQRHFGRIRDHHCADQGLQLVMQIPGARRCLQHDNVNGLEVDRRPFAELVEVNTPGTEHYALGLIDTGGNHVLLVDVEGNKADPGCGHIAANCFVYCCLLPDGDSRGIVWGSRLHSLIRARLAPPTVSVEQFPAANQTATRALVPSDLAVGPNACPPQCVPPARHSLATSVLASRYRMPNSYVFRVAASAEGIKTVLRRLRPQEADLLEAIDRDIEHLQAQLDALRARRKDILHVAWQRGNVVRLNEVQDLLRASII